MPKLGDRVIIEGSKVGQQRREGSLIGVTGRLLNVRWTDGSTSLLTPGAGSIRFLPKGEDRSGATRSSKAVAAGRARAAGAPKKATVSRKTAAAATPKAKATSKKKAPAKARKR